MPETHFTIRWPDGIEERCYSPSTIVFRHFEEGADYPLEDFMRRADEALSEASARVRARYGFACSSALDQLRRLQVRHQELARGASAGHVRVLSLEADEPRDARAAVSAATAPGQTKVPSETLISVVVIGAGQAGLSMSYLLKQRDIEHVVLEKHRVGHSWRSERWDSFCLVTPNWQCRLPGYSYQQDDPQGFMVKDEIVAFLQGYAASFNPPLREGVTVKRVTPKDGGFLVETSAGNFLAGQVIVASGGYHTPRVPEFASELPPSILQLHSRDYRRPDQLPEGEILVVGSGQSGCQIVEDLMLAGRKVHLSVGDAPRCARRYRGKDVVQWLEMMGHYDIPIEEMPDPRAARSKTNHYVTGRDGGHDIDLREFAQRGLRLYGSATTFKEGRLHFSPNLKSCLDQADDTYRRINKSIDQFILQQGIRCEQGQAYQAVWQPEQEAPPLDLGAANITSIVWSIGFSANYDWLDVDAFDERGNPRHQRGVTEVEGLYFLGLPWLHTWGSGRFCGVSRDAEHLRYHVQAHLSRAPVLSV